MSTSAKLYYIGVDVGTGSARACIVDNEGELMAHTSCVIQTWESQPGRYEQSTEDIWRVVCTVVKEAILQSGIESHVIRSIAFAATCSLAVHTHAINEPVDMSSSNNASSSDIRNVLLWMDRRADVEAAFINGKKNGLLKYLGGEIGVLMELPKVLWLKRNLPEEMYGRCKFYNLNDALTSIATGDVEICCTKACEEERLAVGVDGAIKGWDREFLAEIGLEDLAADGFKQVGGVCKHGRYPTAGTPVGKLCEKAARELCLSSSVVVGYGIIDSYAGWVGTIGAQLGGSGNEEIYPVQSRLALVAGTSTCLIVASTAPVFVDGIWGPYQDLILPGLWYSEAHQPASGHLLQQTIQCHPLYSEAVSLAKSQDSNIFDFLNAHLKKMSTLSNAPSISHLAPHLSFHHPPPLSIPRLLAVSTLETFTLLYYTVLEHLAFQIHHTITKLNTAGHEITSIFMSGSQCQNGVLVDIIATVCGLPVVIPRYEGMAVCYGAALLAVKAGMGDGDGEGGTEEIWEVMRRLSKRGKVVKPVEDGEVKGLLDGKYRAFLVQAGK